jgi:cytochrome c biogenesis protein CcmG/thiol:disulfide interchange protein DsbE
MRERLLLSFGLLALAATPAWAAPKIGGPAPDFAVKTVAGQDLNLASLHGKVVILTFWATWCAPCRQELAAFETYYETHRSEGLEIVAINQDDPDNAKTVTRLMSSFTFSSAFDKRSSYDRYGRISELPVSIVIDRDGVIRADSRQGGWVFDAPRLEAAVTPLLTAKP